MEQSNIVIVGSGGNSRVVASCCLQSSKWHVLYIIDINFKGQDESILGIDVVGQEKLHDIKSQCNDAFISIGDNKLRALWYEKIRSLGFNTPNIISNTAHIDPSARLGEGNLFCEFSFIGPECIIGNNNILNTRSSLEHESILGSNSHMSPSSTTGGRCHIGSEVFVGTGAVILPTTKIPNNTIIGANSLVTHSLTSHGTYVGSPVRKIR